MNCNTHVSVILIFPLTLSHSFEVRRRCFHVAKSILVIAECRVSLEEKRKNESQTNHLQKRQQQHIQIRAH